jgi:hypothetical protein
MITGQVFYLGGLDDDVLLEMMRAHADSEAIAFDTAVTTYQSLLAHVATWQERFGHIRLAGAVVVWMVTTISRRFPFCSL